MESCEEMDFEVNSDIKCKVSLYQGEITKIHFDALMNATNETVGGGGIDEAIHEAARPGLLDECLKSSSCQIGECKVTLGYIR